MFMDEQIHYQLLRIVSDVLSGQSAGQASRIEQDACNAHESDKSQINQMSGDMCRDLLKESINHHVFPLVVDGLMSQKNESVSSVLRSKKLWELYQNEIVRQAQKTADFLLFYEYLSSKDLHPLVMKGIVCRSLYPYPEHRSSVDEDLLIDPSEFDNLHEAVLAYGFDLVSAEDDIRTAGEVSYENRDKNLYIEIHKMPFAPDAKAYAYLNSCFRGAMERGITMDICATTVHTLGYTDHLLYLILHALKHFLYSGFGIRQVCDIALFAERFGDEIDWSRVKTELQSVSALEFAGALFKISDRYLLKKNHYSDYLRGWNLRKIDEEPLLIDIMTDGIYGVDDINRAHSVEITLNAAASGVKGRLNYGIFGILKSIFPGKGYLQRQYPYAMRYPVLLPMAWANRMIQYLWDKDRKPSDPMKSIRIGQERTALMRQYNIIYKRDR